MNFLKFLKSNQFHQKWYQKLLWWEIMRIPYNCIMFLFGIGSLMIGAINIPIIYILIGLGLNLIYTIFGIGEVFSKKIISSKDVKSYRKSFFIGYLIFSIASIYFLAFLILI